MAELPVRFAPRSALQTDLRTAVDSWFTTHGTARTAPAHQKRKVAILLGSWVTLLATFGLWGPGYLGAMLLALPLGLVLGGIGFSVMHDANHGAFSRNPKVNAALGFTLDLLGASSFVWRIKHNQVHHAFTNMEGLDDDLEMGKLGRLSPSQPHYAFHRFQHIYLWPLYGFISIKWHWFDDFLQMRAGHIGPRAIPRLTRGQWAQFVTGKVMFFSWALVMPIAVAGVGPGLTLYFVSQTFLGVILAVVFQLAHCVEPAGFMPVADRGAPVDFVRHQLMTTIDFAPGNRLVTWYVGGLNYQAVHHLFPQVSHGWYPQIAPVIARVAAEHGAAYQSIPTLRAAIASHYRFIKRMGRPVTEVASGTWADDGSAPAGTV